jgi:hypothetical protein
VHLQPPGYYHLLAMSILYSVPEKAWKSKLFYVLKQEYKKVIVCGYEKLNGSRP